MIKRYKISFEEINEDKDPLELMDDKGDVLVTQKRLALELDDDISKIDKQTDLAEGLEALREIASRLDTPTPMQVALFRTVANMAVIGTEQNASDFLPAMEANKHITLEGFTDRIKEIISKIIEFFKGLYKKIKEFVINLFNGSLFTKKTTDKTEQEIESKAKNNEKPVSNKIKVKTSSVSKEDASNINLDKLITVKEITIDKVLFTEKDIKKNNISIATLRNNMFVVDKAVGTLRSLLGPGAKVFIDHQSGLLNKALDSFNKNKDEEAFKLAIENANTAVQKYTLETVVSRGFKQTNNSDDQSIYSYENFPVTHSLLVLSEENKSNFKLSNTALNDVPEFKGEIDIFDILNLQKEYKTWCEKDDTFFASNIRNNEAATMKTVESNYDALFNKCLTIESTNLDIQFVMAVKNLYNIAIEGYLVTTKCLHLMQVMQNARNKLIKNLLTCYK